MSGCLGSLMMDAVLWRNVSFSVPWGIISGKECGPNNGTPFLGLHGWLDNANTFDKLVPFLPKDIHFVAVDFPGHGRSSHKPPGAPYYFPHQVTDVRRVVNQLQWKEFSIIAHSMGAAIAAFYAGTFPTDIRHLVLIEIGFPVHLEEANPAEVLARFINLTLSEKQTKSSTYPDTAAVVANMVNNRTLGLTENAARVLARRGCVLREDGSGLEFSHDKRLRNQSYEVATVKSSKAFFSRIKCRVLYVKAEYQFGASHVLSEKYLSSVEERMAVIRENAQDFVLEVIPGGHHVHLENPEMVARGIEVLINSCPNSRISKL